MSRLPPALLGPLVAVLTAAPSAVRAQAPATAVNPEEHPPANVTRLVTYGERPAWSPDDKRIAFMSKSYGDAVEIDLATGNTHLLTGGFAHAGFLRVQYLPNGDLVLIGARTFTDAKTTRERDEELWVLRAGSPGPPTPLGHKVFEGVAISRRQMKIAWANTHAQYPEFLPEGESVIYTAEVTYSGGKPALENTKEVLRAHRPECTLEPQDFRDEDKELIYTCYRSPYADVMGVEIKSARVKTYRKVPDEYNEVEGTSPDGKWTLVESSRDQGSGHQDFHHIDIWRLWLEGSRDFERLTRWGDYPGFKASNPVVSNDGKRIAFQSGRTDEAAGVGHGIFVLTLP
jgi:Tol biopolymer transport system component